MSYIYIADVKEIYDEDYCLDLMLEKVEKFINATINGMIETIKIEFIRVRDYDISPFIDFRI